VVRDPVENEPRVVDVVKGRARHDRAQLVREVGVLELDPSVAGTLGRGRIDSEGLVPGLNQQRNETTVGPAAQLHHHCRRCGQ
jgi:hypothetical protein